MKNIKAEQLIDSLYNELYDKLFVYAVAALKDKKAAEDVVQDTFLVAMNRAEKV
mgnify:CR=1 FL=1